MNKKTQASSKAKGISGVLHDGLIEIIFSYIGLNQTTANCRLVCKRWKKVFHKYIRSMIKETSKALEEQKHKNSQFLLPEESKADFDNLVKTKKEYLKIVEKIPLKYSLFHRLSDIGRLNKPPAILKYGCLAIFSLIFSKNDFKDLKKNGWTFCKQKLMMKKFPLFMLKVDPNTLTQAQITSYQELVQAMQITADYLWRESAQVAMMFEWAEKILLYRDLSKRLTPEGKELLAAYHKETEIQNKIIEMQEILKLS